MQTRTVSLTTLALGLILALPAHAALQSRLNGAAVYDTDLNVTWLTNANLIASNTFGLNYNQSYGTDSYGYQSIIYSNGIATWGGAQKWVAAMDAANYLGYHDWALPTTLQPDASCGSQYGGDSYGYGYGCTGSQMGHLFYSELGGVVGQSITTTHNANYALFSNLQSDVYWSGTVYAPNPNFAWDFYTYDGGQGASVKGYYNFALAVRSGDVAAAPVPESDSVMLIALGMGLVGWMARRRG